jgi:hypothetical protein
MQMLPAALAACGAGVVVTRASILGQRIERLSVEAKGHFDIRSYLDLEASGSGFRCGFPYRAAFGSRRVAGADRPAA